MSNSTFSRRLMHICAAALVMISGAKCATSYTVSTLAGVSTFQNGSLSNATFNEPYGLTIDSLGNMYCADQLNNSIRKISSIGLVTTFAGNGASGANDGIGSQATFNHPCGVAVDSVGNVYVADSFNASIRKISSSGKVTTLAAKLNYCPTDIITDFSGNIYVSEGNISGTKGDILKISPDGNTVILASGFLSPCGIALDSSGNVFVADYGKNAIYKISTHGNVTILAGSGTKGFKNGQGSQASFSFPNGLALDTSGNILVADYGNNAIRKITSTGTVTTFAGSGLLGAGNGIGTQASFNGPQSITIDSSGNIYVSEYGNNSIRKITTNGLVTSYTGLFLFTNGNVKNATFNQPVGVAVDSSENVYVADSANNAIRKISAGGIVSTLAGKGLPGDSNGASTNALFNGPNGVAVDPVGNVFVADELNNKIKKISPHGVVTDFVGNGAQGSLDGIGIQATFFYPTDVTIASSGYIYVIDGGRNAIRLVSPTTNTTTLVGSSPLNQMGFGSLNGIGVDSSSNVYVADYISNVILKISPIGAVKTFAGNGAAGFVDGNATLSSFNGPTGVSIDHLGNVYVTDTGNHAIRMISPAGVVTTIAGNGSVGFQDGDARQATFATPSGITIDSFGDIYVADSGNNMIRLLTPNKAPNQITFTALPSKTYGAASFSLSASASSGLPVSFSSSITSVATISGNVLTIAGAGTTTITANQGGSSTVVAATPVSQTLVVNKATNPITFIQPAATNYSPNGMLKLYATAPGGTVGFTCSNSSVLAIAGAMAAIKGTGTATVTASQAGNANYLPATTVSLNVVINKTSQTITFKPTSPISYATTKSFSLSGSSTSGLTVSYASSATNIISISGSTATVKKAGTATITASCAGNANYNAATPVAVSVTVQ